MTEQAERAKVCAIAREWVGTPFRDCAEVKGRNGGVDCAKLIYCVFNEAGKVEKLTIPAYSPQHFLHHADEKFLGWVQSYAHEIPEDQAQPADIVLYKLGKCFSHGAIIIDPGWPNIIHAWFQARMVVRGHGLDGQLGKPTHVRKYFSRW